MSVAIACSTGGFKGVFLHGVLAGLEAAGFRADAYAAASSSVLPAAAAAVGQAGALGVDFWLAGRQLIENEGVWMSQMVLSGIEQFSPRLITHLFGPEAPRFLIAANLVDESGSAETQGTKARRLGRSLLLAAVRGDSSWVDEHLTLQLFDTASEDEALRLTPGNFQQIAYASSRMLHAWEIPAWVGGWPYVDAFYTCACPAQPLAERGYKEVIALSNEPLLYQDIFQRRQVPTRWQGAAIHIISPDSDPAEMGVDFTKATVKGLQKVYEHGLEKADSFLDQHS